MILGWLEGLYCGMMPLPFHWAAAQSALLPQSLASFQQKLI